MPVNVIPEMVGHKLGEFAPPKQPYRGKVCTVEHWTKRRKLTRSMFSPAKSECASLSSLDRHSTAPSSIPIDLFLTPSPTSSQAGICELWRSERWRNAFPEPCCVCLASSCKAVYGARHHRCHDDRGSAFTSAEYRNTCHGEGLADLLSATF